MKKFINILLLIGIVLTFSCEEENEDVFSGIFSEGELAEAKITVGSISDTEAKLTCSISYAGKGHLLERGICWSTKNNAPTLKDSRLVITNSRTVTITKLTPGTIYFVRPYMTNTKGTGYGEAINFTTKTTPTLSTTVDINSVNDTSAIVTGNITKDGGSPIIARGVCWSTTTNPTIALSTKTSNGTGAGTFRSSITGLNTGTTYYVRAYATNSAGTAYGTQVSFTTTTPIALPTLSTTAVTNITETSATGGGNVTNDGGAAVSSKGVCWSTTTNPIYGTAASNYGGAGTGSFTCNLPALTKNTKYYVRAYASNTAGTAYGAEVTFTTSSGILTCGAYIAPSVWKEFMCHNLGANTSLDPMTYSDGINGDLYQWGRPTDGHEKWASSTTTILASSNTPGHSDFIIGSSDWRSGGGNDTRWTDATKAANDPCPSGFKVPSQAQWAGVVANNQRGTWASGYKFGDKLFLPASGYRNGGDGSLGNVGSSGSFWSSTVVGTYAYELFFANGNVGAADGSVRANGFSVRCVAE